MIWGLLDDPGGPFLFFAADAGPPMKSLIV
jgi:hypothetical protein